MVKMTREEKRRGNRFGCLVALLLPSSCAGPTVFVHLAPETACGIVSSQLSCPNGRTAYCSRVGGSSNTSRGFKGGSVHAYCEPGYEGEISTAPLSMLQYGTTAVLVIIVLVFLGLVFRSDLRAPDA